MYTVVEKQALERDGSWSLLMNTIELDYPWMWFPSSYVVQSALFSVKILQTMGGARLVKFVSLGKEACIR